MAAESPSQGRDIKRDADYLGIIREKLGDLAGFETLAHELIQNAEDSGSASTVTFDVCDEALIVDNDGQFADCGDPTTTTCVWKDDRSRGYSCDFHNLQTVAGGQKLDRRSSIGAFGVGFIAVYQITDRPQIISGGRHWEIREELPASQRIHEFPWGLADDAVAGTRFILPWARDPESDLRRSLRATHVSTADILQMPALLARASPHALLFLSNVHTVRVCIDGQEYARYGRVLAGTDSGPISRVTVEGPTSVSYLCLRGAFAEEANALRRRYGKSVIEPRRREVTELAVPVEDEPGRLFATLPTQVRTELPVHISADFFPHTDRKRVILEDPAISSPQSEWNRAAIQAGAATLAGHLVELSEPLGPFRTWEVVLSAFKGRTRGRPMAEAVFGSYWDALVEVLSASPVAYTTEGAWCLPTEVHVLRDESEAEAVGVLEAMGVKLLHGDLRPLALQGLVSASVGLTTLGLDDVLDAAEARFGYGTRPLGIDAPPLGAVSGTRTLWREIARLSDRTAAAAKGKQVARLREIALVPCIDGQLWPAASSRKGDQATRAVFEGLGMPVPWLDEQALGDDLPFVTGHVAVAGVIDLVEQLEALASNAEALTARSVSAMASVFEWLMRRRSELDHGMRARLAALPIFPAGNRMRPLSEVSLAGDFDDPIGLAEILSLPDVDAVRPLLIDLGAEPLSFRSYVMAHLPRSIHAGDLDDELMEAVIWLLARKLPEIRDDEAVRDVLRKLPLVPCTDGAYRAAGSVYFYIDDVGRVLSVHGVHYAAAAREHRQAVDDLYRWLGVADRPRIHDVLARIDWLTTRVPPTATWVRELVHVFEFAALKWTEDPDYIVRQLSTRAWLPADGDAESWRRPQALYTSFQRSLFTTQADFLGLPLTVQQKAADFLRALGMPTEPDVEMVVGHVISRSNNAEPISLDVWQYLTRHADDPALNKLIDRACLPIGDRYVRPSHVFLGQHPFGRYRWRAGIGLEQHLPLLRRLGVRDGPDVEDAIAVLSEIAAKIPATNQHATGDDVAIVHACWAFLAERADEVDLSALSHKRLALDVHGVFSRPADLFFEDRAGMAAKFGSAISSSVIPRDTETWRALASAGVRDLSDAAVTVLLEYADPVEASSILEQVAARSQQLRRIADVHGVPLSPDELRDRLPPAASRGSSLLIRYEVTAGAHRLSTEPETVAALVEDATRNLLFVASDDVNVPWSAIARVLAGVILPEVEPAAAAAAVAAVLSASSVEAADRWLDEFGYPPLSYEQYADPEAPSVEQFEGVAPDVPDPGPERQEALGTEVNAEAAQPDGDSDDDAKAQQPGHPGIIEKDYVLRSYVYERAKREPLTNRSSDADQRTTVDELGIKHVVNYELAHGRQPTVMPHDNEGFDIESRDRDGTLVRTIEVKSRSGRWTNGPVALSRPQFEMARELGDRFWLYVVEKSGSETADVHPIQDPARRVGQFVYDAGWLDVVEEESTHQESSG